MEAIPLPKHAKVENLGEHKYSLTLEPLYPGYGVTIGNALRRVLLSSLPGAAVTAMKIKFVDHEFSTVPNVKEDVIQILLSIKQLRVKSTSTEPVRLQLKVKGERTVTAADIQETDQVQVLNKDLHLVTLDSKNAEFEMELIVEQGRGYVPVEMREHQHLEIGMIAVDAIYTPVRSVHFDVTNVRVGQLTNFDKLTVVLETDGTLEGTECFDIASHILVDHFTMVLSQGFTEQVSPTFVEQPTPEIAMAEPTSSDDLIDNTTLSTRAKNALAKRNITALSQLHSLSSDEISNIEGLGDKTITEILTYLNR